MLAGRLMHDDRYELRCLVTTVHEPHGESSVHEVPKQLLQAHSEAIGLPLHTVTLSDGLEDYSDGVGRERMERQIRTFDGAYCSGFGAQLSLFTICHQFRW